MPESFGLYEHSVYDMQDNMIQYAFSKNSGHNTCNYNSNLVCMPIGRTSGIDPRVLLSLDWSTLSQPQFIV